MESLFERPWHPDDDDDEQPSQVELDDMADQWTEEEWEAEQERLMDLWYGPLPTHLRRRTVPTNHEEQAA